MPYRNNVRDMIALSGSVSSSYLKNAILLDKMTKWLTFLLENCIEVDSFKQEGHWDTCPPNFLGLAKFVPIQYLIPSYGPANLKSEDHLQNKFDV